MNMKRNVILYFYNLGKFNIRANQVKKKYVTPVIKNKINYNIVKKRNKINKK